MQRPYCDVSAELDARGMTSGWSARPRRSSVPFAQLTVPGIAFKRSWRTERPLSSLAPPIRPTPSLSLEQAFEQRVPGHTGMLGNVAQDAGQCANWQGRVAWNGDVMLAALKRGVNRRWLPV